MCEPTVFQSTLFKPYATKEARAAQKSAEGELPSLDDVQLYITRTGKFLSTNEMRERTRTVNCKHWLHGFCKYGDACNFAHPTAQHLTAQRESSKRESSKRESSKRERGAQKKARADVLPVELPVELTAAWREQQADDACVMPIARHVHRNLGPDVDRQDFLEAMQHAMLSWVPRNHVLRLIESIDRVSDRVMHDSRKKRKRKRRRKRKRISGAARHAKNSENRVLLAKVRASQAAQASQEAQARQTAQANQVELESFPDLDTGRSDVFDSACEDDVDELLLCAEKLQTLSESKYASQYAARKAEEEPANPLNFLLGV